MSISIEQLLSIPGVEVLKTEISEREISIHVKIESNYTRCHQCGGEVTLLAPPAREPARVDAPLLAPHLEIRVSLEEVADPVFKLRSLGPFLAQVIDTSVDGDARDVFPVILNEELAGP